MKGPTIVDVAQKAGVSVASVSRVIKNKRPISQENRNKVLAAIKDLNYEPKRKPSISNRTVAIVIPDPLNSCFIEIANGAEIILLANGYLPTILFANSDKNYYSLNESNKKLKNSSFDFNPGLKYNKSS